VLKITAGDNVKIDSGNLSTVFVCPGDKVKISPASGYSLPENYINKATGLNGVKYSAERFSFSDDVVLPSIYKVLFNGYNKVHATFYVVGGLVVPVPQKNPEREGYYFDGWDVSSTLLVTSDLSIKPIWDPITHNVYFGPNLIVEVGSKYYFFEEGSHNPPRTIKIKSDENVVIKSIFDLTLPDDFGPQSGVAFYKGGYFEILSDCSFPGVTTFEFIAFDGKDSYIYSATIGTGHTITLEPTVKKDGYAFMGWTYEDKLVIGQIVVENKQYVLYANWKLTDVF